VPSQFKACVRAKVSQALGQQLEAALWHAVEPLAQLWFVAQLFVSPAQKVFGQILRQLWGRWAQPVLEFGQLFLPAFAQLLYSLVEARLALSISQQGLSELSAFCHICSSFVREEGCDDDQQQQQRQKHKKNEKFTRSSLPWIQPCIPKSDSLKIYHKWALSARTS
jgi:hypothetical protein